MTEKVAIERETLEEIYKLADESRTKLNSDDPDITEVKKNQEIIMRRVDIPNNPSRYL